MGLFDTVIKISGVVGYFFYNIPKRVFSSNLIALGLRVILVTIILSPSFSQGSPDKQNPETDTRSLKRPTVIFSNPDVVVGSISRVWGGWEIRYGSRQRPTEHTMTISENSSGGTAGGGFKVVWN